ncbi:MAG: NADH-quinone oxidoreductase subunit N [Bdellovibrio sp.]|nr:MAG: NADH-quinone oxidoreductase subunit N [Bdellovibrio sp.]
MISEMIAGIQFSTKELFIVSPLIILFLMSLLPLSLKVLRGNKEIRPSVAINYAFAGVISALILVFSFFGEYGQDAYMAFNKAIVLDGVSLVSTVLVLVTTAISLFYLKENVATNLKQLSENIFLIMNSAIGMIIVILSQDLIITFIGVEIMSLCLYILIALSHEGSLSKEASFKYFLLGSFASAIFLYGIAFIYGSTATTSLIDLRSLWDGLSVNRLLFVGVILTVVGFCFKVAVAPFHAWAPDVYEGSSTPLTGFMATGVKAATFIAFLRFMTLGVLEDPKVEGFTMVLEWLAVLTMIVGNVAAIMQERLKRMLAYSSIAHSGYVMLALIAASLGGESVLGASGVIYYLLVYTAMTLGAFGIISYLERHYEELITFNHLKGLATSHPWLSFSFSVFLLSLAGVPPTLGFVGKFYIFTAAIEQKLYWAVGWGVLASVVSVYYYLKPIVYLYMFKADTETVPIEGRKPLTGLAFAFAVVFVLGGLFFIDPIYNFIFRSSSYLFG